MKQILITGGAGFIGSHLARKFVQQGFYVVIVDDLSMGRISNIKDILPKIKFYCKNVCNYKFMHVLLNKYNFTYIYYLAAVASVADSISRPWYTHEVNMDSVLNILNYIRIHHINIKKFLFTSSAAVYGNTNNLPIKEDSYINPLSPYAIDKYASERYTLNFGKLYGLPTVCTRFFNVYGPNQNPNSPYSGVLSILTDCLLHHKIFHLYGSGHQTRDFVYINDVINALILVSMKSNDCSVYNIATGQDIQLLDIMRIYQKISNEKLQYDIRPFRKGDIKKSVANISKIDKLGYHPKWSLQRGLQAYWRFEVSKLIHSK